MEPALGGTELESSRYSVPLRSPLGTRCKHSWAEAAWAPVASRHEEAEAWGWAGGAALGLGFGSCPAGKGTGRSWRHPPGLAPALSASACVRSGLQSAVVRSSRLGLSDPPRVLLGGLRGP